MSLLLSPMVLLPLRVRCACNPERKQAGPNSGNSGLLPRQPSCATPLLANLDRDYCPVAVVTDSGKSACVLCTIEVDVKLAGVALILVSGGFHELEPQLKLIRSAGRYASLTDNGGTIVAVAMKEIR